MSETFDTLGAARKLRGAGMDQDQAEAVSGVVHNSRNGLATKADVAILSGRIGTLQWIVGLNVAMTMAILVVMLTNALQP